MKPLELLSPARNLECGISAIDHGADAVYIGASKFGARAAAGNSVEDIATLCRYAHQYNAKVYVTVNTIIFDNEMSETIELIKQLQAIGVDAILIQDMGLLQELCRQNINIPIHASTQTDNKTAEKVKWLASMGIKRVVLARELSITEIAQIHKAVPEVELEVFVHGALCVSYSGQCYASQQCFGRSANRGACAQFCRMAFDLVDADGKMIEKSRYLLSLRDMSQLENLQQLAKAGAVSFKIEGRLKNVDYVKNITAAYSEKLNSLCSQYPNEYSRASMGKCTYTFTPNIHKSFNRGFTKYFANGRTIPAAQFYTPKAIGEPIGTVKEIRGNYFTVSSISSFNNGDGLCFFTHDKQLIGFRVNKTENNKLFPLSMPKQLRPGMQLFRNHDQAFETLLSKPSSVRRIPIDMVLHIGKEELLLSITDEQGHNSVASLPYRPQTANKPQEDNIKKQLTKLGNTIYICNTITIHNDIEQPFIANSLISEIRRIACDNMLQTLTNKERQTQHPKAININPQPCVAMLHSALPYLYNASNRQAKDFYKNLGIDATAFETSLPQEPVIMQCRYCLKAELGYCTKNGKKTPWHEPLSLRLSDGKTFQIRFNCKQCEMEIMA